MCTYIMYLPVMSSFLWPYCCCIHRLSIQTVTVNIPQPRQEDILPDHRDFVSFIFTYSYFPFLHSPLQFPFYIHHMPSNQISSLPYRPFKEPAFLEQCTVSLTSHSIAYEECFLNLSKCFLKTMALLNYNQFPCDLNPLCFKESGLFSLKRNSEN